MHDKLSDYVVGSAFLLMAALVTCAAVLLMKEQASKKPLSEIRSRPGIDYPISS